MAILLYEVRREFWRSSVRRERWRCVRIGFFRLRELRDAIAIRVDRLNFLQRHNPILRHTVLRKRATPEDMGLLDRIAVDIWPSENDPLPMFEGLAVPTSAEFDAAYAAAKDFVTALRHRAKSAGLCSR